MSKIEWTDITYNPVTGCEKISPGCQNCYAEKMANRLQYNPKMKDKYKNGFKVTCHPKELKRDFGKRSKKIFVCSMGDLFHDNVSYEFIDQIFLKMIKNPQHIFQILTKRPENTYKYQEATGFDWPENVWFGVTAENQEQYDKRVYELASINTKIKFVSIEPILGPIHLYGRVAEWVIVGGETGQRARPMNPDWARNIRDQCIEHNIPFFFKQMSKKQPIPNDLDIKEFPEDKSCQK